MSMMEKVIEEAKSLLDFNEVGHVLLYIIRKYIEDHCTCGVQASDIFGHHEGCKLRENVLRYAYHAVERQREAVEAVRRAENPPPPPAPLPRVFGPAPRPLARDLAELAPVPPRAPLPAHDATDHKEILRAIRESNPEAFRAAVHEELSKK